MPASLFHDAERCFLIAAPYGLQGAHINVIRASLTFGQRNVARKREIVPPDVPDNIAFREIIDYLKCVLASVATCVEMAARAGSSINDCILSIEIYFFNHGNQNEGSM